MRSLWRFVFELAWLLLAVALIAPQSTWPVVGVAMLLAWGLFWGWFLSKRLHRGLFTHEVTNAVRELGAVGGIDPNSSKWWRNHVSAESAEQELHDMGICSAFDMNSCPLKSKPEDRGNGG